MGGRASRNRKAMAAINKVETDKKEAEFSKLLDKLEVEPHLNPLLCLPSNLPEIHYFVDGKVNVIKIPAFGRLFGKGEFRHDAYFRHVWTQQECEQMLNWTSLYGNPHNHDDYDDWTKYNIEAWKKGKKKAQIIFSKGGKVCEEEERYIPQLNDPILKHFVRQCIERVLETMHIPHEQKIDAVGLMFAAWFQPKEANNG